MDISEEFQIQTFLTSGLDNDLDLGIDLNNIDFNFLDQNTSSTATNLPIEERRVESEEELIRWDNLDFDLNKEIEILGIFNQSQPPNTSEHENSYLDLINSPSAEMTFTLNEMGSPAENNDESSLISSFSPASSSNFSYRKTRARTIDKKESNKAAAIKYRNKKVKERELLFAERDEYERKNAELRKKIDECQTELSFIKSLLVQALISKNKAK